MYGYIIRCALYEHKDCLESNGKISDAWNDVILSYYLGSHVYLDNNKLCETLQSVPYITILWIHSQPRCVVLWRREV